MKSEKKSARKIWDENNPEKVREYRRQWNLRNPLKRAEIRRQSMRRDRLKKHPIQNLNGKIAALVPANISGLVREDICQQIAVEILSGKILLKDVPAHIERIRKEQSKFLPSSYLYRLDALEPWQRERVEQRVIARTI